MSRRSRSIRPPFPSLHTRSKRTSKGVHAIDTEARTLEQAVNLLAEQQGHARSGRTNKGGPKKLRQLFCYARSRADLLKMHGKISLAGGGTNPKNPKLDRTKPKGPHPFRDLTPEQQRAKAREMYYGGHWGIGVPAYRRIAFVFAVS